MSTGNSLAMMPWFPRDYIAATRGMTLAQRGAYCDLLFYQWETGPLPEDTAALCRLLGCSSKEFASIWRVVGQKFIATDSGYVNPRLEEHRAKSKQLTANRSHAGRVGGIKSAEQRSSKNQANVEANGKQTGKQNIDFASSKTQPPSPSPSPKNLSKSPHTSGVSSPVRAEKDPEKGSVCGTFTKIGGEKPSLNGTHTDTPIPSIDEVMAQLRKDQPHAGK